MKILVTGGAGFIGSNFILQLLENDPQIEIVNLDSLTYAGNLENLRSIEGDPRHRFVHGDICNKEDVAGAWAEDIEACVHFAAESHVDRSVEGPEVFLQTNVMGTQILLERQRQLGHGRFVMVSTDEVYGSLGAEGAFTEETPLAPNSPYSASKASADLLCRAYHHTFGMDVVTTRCSNNYGRFQFPEKLIPLMIANALEDKALPVYGDGKNVRDWLHVGDHCSAIDAVMRKGQSGRIYNVGGNSERQNIEVVKVLLDALGKSHDLITYVKDRPGHDLRYAIDASRIRDEIGWEPSVVFEDGIAGTIQWYLDNGDWLEQVRSGAYRGYYEKMYGERLGGGGG
ncbi:dTDP-glucose 4,6-dehydratase [bacterium]|nr:MAG: dTDP-glucose 4,6-dehydratase [bacterium]